MTNDERIIANKYQLQVYLGGLEPQWRLLSIKAIRKMFENYEIFFADIVPTQTPVKEFEKQIKLGLAYSAVAEVMQYIEDLFSLMHTSKDIDNLIKNMVNYIPNKVAKYIETFESMTEAERLPEMLMPYFPDDEPWENLDVQEQYIIVKKNTTDYLDSIIAFRKKYKRFYLQYKHGLKTPLNPFCNHTQFQMDVDSTAVPIYRYENKIENFNNNSLIIPQLHPCFSQVASSLATENNLLLYEAVTVDFDELTDIATKTYKLLVCLHQNLMFLAQSEKTTTIREVKFPVGSTMDLLCTIGFPLDIEQADIFAPNDGNPSTEIDN